MPKHGKKYQDAVKNYDVHAYYEPLEAMELVKKNASAKFDETVEVAIRLNLDPRQADQQVRGAVVLPHGTGVSRRVLVFAKGDKAKEAEEAAQISWVQKSWLPKSKAVGLILMLLLRPLI